MNVVIAPLPQPAPTVNSLNPTHGPAAGGNSVTITGTNFTNVTAVKFGAIPVSANNYTVNPPTQITVTAPAGTSGSKVDVSVTTSAGTSPNTTADDYTYDIISGFKIDVELLAVATPTNQDTITVLPSMQERFVRGTTFYVEIWVKNQDGSANGITGGSLDFSFDASLMTGKAIDHGSIYTTLADGLINNTAGLVNDLAGNASPGVVDKGDNEWVRLGYIQFTADAGGTCSLIAAPGSDSFARAGEGSISWENVELNQSVVSISIDACIYDIDENGNIGNGDYSYLSSAWHSQPNSGNWNGRVDFDGDDYIGNGDYSWLSSNWHKNADDQSITYPTRSDNTPSRAIAIDVELVLVTQPTNNETVAVLPAGILEVNVDQSFYLEIWVKNMDGSSNGITGASLDFSFAQSLVTAGNINHGSLYTTLTDGTVINETGLIDNLGGNTTPGVVDKGATEWVRIGYVPFTAKATGTASFTAASGSDSFARAGEGSIAWLNIELNAPQVSIQIGTAATLTMAVVGNGTVTPVQGVHEVPLNEPQDITADADANCHFVNWTATGGATVADPDATETTVTLTAAGRVTANFVETQNSDFGFELLATWNTGINYTLRMLADAESSDEYIAGEDCLTDLPLPPLPSPTAEEAFFQLPGGDVKLLWDSHYLDETVNMLTWHLMLAVSAGTHAELTWDELTVPAGWLLSIRDDSSKFAQAMDTESSLLLEMPGMHVFTITAIRESEYATFTYQLQRGWNMISIPLQLTRDSEEFFFEQNLMSVNTLSNSYEQPGTLTPGKAYWLFCENDTELTVDGTMIQNYQMTILSGWNFVGPVNDHTLPCSDFTVWEWTNEGYRQPETASDTFLLKAGKGYWIFSQ